MDRSQTLNRVRSQEGYWDIIVIGGGATGAGCAVDAAARGHSVLLLEQHDFGKGTSSRSTKLVHGGVRYLKQGDISMVREALAERAILLHNAPHVVHTQPFLVPCYSYWQKLYYGIGLKIYDLLAGGHGIGRSRTLGRAETLERSPNLEPKGLKGSVVYYDGRFDDSRLLIDLLLTADKYGAAVLNYARVESFVRYEDGRIAGVTFVDAESGEKLTANGRTVINAAGIFCDGVRRSVDINAEPLVSYAQGIHLVFDRRFLPSDDAVMIPKTTDGRVLFCIPWHGYVLVGTTDTPVDAAELEPAALDAEIDFVLETAGRYMTERPTRTDILSAFAGIRPLLRSSVTQKTSAMSRSHGLIVDEFGLVTITGGKWTTYRRMAEDAVNRAEIVAGLEKRRCVTATLAVGDARSSTTDAISPNHEGVRRAVRDEMARTVEDVLARRSRTLFLDAEKAIKVAPMVALSMASEMGKDEAWIDGQIEAFKKVAAVYLTRRT